MSLDALFCIAFFAIQCGTYGLMVFFCNPGTPRRLVSRVAIVALLYPFGEMLQVFHGIPQFIRWHLSDFGYVPYQAITVYSFYLIYKWVRSRNKNNLNDYFKDTPAITAHISLVGLVLFAVTGYELLVDSTDMIDILMHFAGAFIALVAYKKLGEYLKETDIPSTALIVPSIAR